MPHWRPRLRDALALCGAIALGACDDEAPPAPMGPGGFQRAPVPVSADAATDAATPDAATPDAGPGAQQAQSLETTVSPWYVYGRVMEPPGVGQMAPVNRQ
jgi:hypothetical protein